MTEQTIAAPATTVRPNWPVLIGSSVLIVGIAVWAIILPDQAGGVIGSAVGWVATNLGWYYILTATLVLGFVIYLALSPMGKTKLGPDHSRPQFRLFTWMSMLFAAGIGIDLLFFSVAEPVAQYYEPPTGASENIEAARQAVVWTLFHYGPVGWAMYALMGGAFAYFAYRRNLPLSIRSLLTPILGNRLRGWAGHTVDIAAVLGTVFGIATSLGIGVVQLNYGLYLLFGIPQGVAAQVGLIVLAVVMATISTVSGVEKGIRRLSELNVILAILLLFFLAITGNTRRLLDGIVMNVGDFVSTFPSMVMNTFAWVQPDSWMSAWTLFFWAWWIAWAPFVGLFLARISRGRTLRQFITGVLVVPFVFIAVFISVLGNSALELIVGGNDSFGQTALASPEQGFYDLLAAYPAAPFVIALATLTGLLFYVTSADSGALVLANFTSIIEDPREDGGSRMRVYWAVVTGVLTMSMLLIGGISTLQNATLIVGVPFSIVLYLVMISLFRALRTEQHQAEGFRATVTARIATVETPWRRRLRRVAEFPDRDKALNYLEKTAEPALRDVETELAAVGVDVSCVRSDVPDVDLPTVVLTARFPDHADFVYQVYPVVEELPTYARRAPRRSDLYYRLEVFTATGSRGYDVYGYTTEQLIADAVAHYESHMEFLRVAPDGQDASIVEDAPVPDWQSDFPTHQS
ncbi:choline BCCT transporter BetT [Microbacterium aurantiacum]|uniref:choline BCCT transporter BetT n=1 Tax=Microbacterium aurantiacum TaxID=162393 RepID=UPI001EFFDD0C|nr:choline BCCT transporter BetT [Microbacterium aurantiacum]